MSRTAEQLVADLEKQLRPLEVELALAWWDSSTKSSEEAEQRRAKADLARRAVLADPDAFTAITEARRRRRR